MKRLDISRQTLWFPATLGISAALMLAGCSHDAETAAPVQPKANLKVDTVHLQNVADALEIPGRVEADPQHVVHIYAPLSGRLMNLNLTVGQEVHKGQTIAISGKRRRCAGKVRFREGSD